MSTLRFHQIIRRLPPGLLGGRGARTNAQNVGTTSISSLAVTRSLSTAPVGPGKCFRYLYENELIPYGSALQWQRKLLEDRVTSEPVERASDATSAPQPRAKEHKDIVVMLQHPHVYTLGRASMDTELLFMQGPDGTPTDELVNLPRGEGKHMITAGVRADVHRVERGGKITYHGPGQLVVYPILDLTKHKKDLHWYVTTIEDVIIDSVGEYGIKAHRYKGYPGVWVGETKIAQVGMNCSKWFTTHGFAINVAPDMSYFGHIVPCGIADKQVTSMKELLRQEIDMREFTKHVSHHFAKRFDVELCDETGEPV